MGTAKMKEEVGQALIQACRHNFGDPEVQQQLLKVVSAEKPYVLLA